MRLLNCAFYSSLSGHDPFLLLLLGFIRCTVSFFCRFLYFSCLIITSIIRVLRANTRILLLLGLFDLSILAAVTQIHVLLTNPPSVPSEQHPPPPEPIIGMPTPVIPNQSLEVEDLSWSSDFLMVDPNTQFDELGNGSGVRMQGGRMRFVGGFVSGLRRLPKAMLRNPKGIDGIDRKGQVRRETIDPVAAESGIGAGLPSYQSYTDQPPRIPANITAFEPADMSAQVNVSIASRSARNSRDPEQTLAEYSDPSQRSNHYPLDGDTILPHQSFINIESPVEVEPLPASDYDKMSPRLHSTPSVSITSHVNRLNKFVHDVNELPWVSSRIVSDYVPEKNGRRGHGKSKIPKIMKTWYPAHIDNDLDLLSNGTPPLSDNTPTMARRRREDHRRALTESPMSPSSAMMFRRTETQSTMSMSPRYSVTSEPGPRGRNLRHNRNNGYHQHSRHQWQHQNQTQPVYPYIAAPQPLYLYPSLPSPPGLQPTGSMAGSPGHGRTTASPGMPVYMIPLPPPVYQPMPTYSYPVGQQHPTNPVAQP